MRSLASYGSDDLRDLIDPKPVGEPINPHVHDVVIEPKPDFAEMQRLIESQDKVLKR